MSQRPTPEQSARIAAIVDEAIELPASERRGRVEQLCGGDRALQQLVFDVLAHDGADDTPFRAAVHAEIDAAARTLHTGAGQRIGPYRVEREIGSGGMGTVFLAARDDREFEHRVAIKVVRGLFGSEGLRRFRAERQILASLVHPHIARLFDGGTTEQGVPYFVMEYVNGAPIDDYCRTKRLSVRDRLGLFLDVCEAVIHAHRRLVVHRDLKPSNILVTTEGVPKLLDFGVAKLLEEDGAAQATMTQGPLFTPEYASPEQVRGDAITTATDVYSLGVLLHELVTDRRLVQLQTRRADEIERVVCEQLPPKPSSVSPWRREVAGDLDTIVLAALEKEPGRRYASVEALAADIHRFLRREPIAVRPASVGYRARRFASRHRWGVAVAALSAMMIAAWMVTLDVERRRAARERDTALEVTRFLVDLFASTDPSETRSATISAREIIDRGAARMPELNDRPAIQARLMDAIGRVYRSLGVNDRAETLLTEARRLHERVEGFDAADTASTIIELGEVHREQGKLDTAEALTREALAIRERQLGPVHADIAQARNNLALILRARGALDEAERLFTDAVAMWRKTLGPRHPQVAVGLSNLVLVLRDRARYAEAERLAREILDIRRQALGTVHPQLANSLMSLGQILDFSGRDREAEPLIREALEMRQKIYGNDHPIVDSSLNNLASVRQDMGDLAGAEPLYRTVLASNQRRLGRHTETAVTMNNLASLLEERGEYAEAEALLREALAIRREGLGPKHSAVARGIHNLARVLWLRGKHAAAEPLVEEALALRREVLGASHTDTAASMALLGMVRASRGDVARGEELVREALDLQRAALRAEHPTIIATEFSLATLLIDAGRATEAEPLLRRIAALRAKTLPATHWLRAHTDATLGRVLVAAGQEAEGQALMTAAHKQLAGILPAADPRVRSAQPQ
jgi:tetratricopeptide (TPR) repeat protein